jgi:hypothetical protein
MFAELERYSDTSIKRNDFALLNQDDFDIEVKTQVSPENLGVYES